MSCANVALSACQMSASTKPMIPSFDGLSTRILPFRRSSMDPNAELESKCPRGRTVTVCDLRTLRERIVSVSNTKKITDAMKLVAAAKVRRAQEAVVNGRPFSETLVQVLYNLNEQLQTEDVDIPLTQIRPVKKIAIVVVTGDRGLCGGYNNFVLKKAERRMAELCELGLNYTVVSIGKKGNSYFNSSFMQAAAESLMSCSLASMATISASAPIPLVTPKLDVFAFGVVMLKLLMYAYMENGSLGQILHGEKAKNLQWCDRWEIVEGIAHALAYLHYDCSPPIVHRDISCNNVLLDSAFQACVSDFGTAKLLDAHTSIFLNVFLLGSLGKRSYLRFSIFSLVAVVFYSVYNVHASYDAECRAATTTSSTPGPPTVVEGHVIELSTAAALSRSFTFCVIDSG